MFRERGIGAREPVERVRRPESDVRVTGPRISLAPSSREPGQAVVWRRGAPRPSAEPIRSQARKMGPHIPPPKPKRTTHASGGRPVGGGGGMAARCAAAFGRTHSLAGSRNGSAYPTAQAKQNSPSRRDGCVWRRRWDSNPRGVSTYLISSQGRYDHFDTPPRPFHYKQTRANCQAREGCRRATG